MTAKLHTFKGALAIGAALLSAAPAMAQMTSGPGLSSGTGQGTGAGGFSGIIRNRSGSVSGSGPGSTSRPLGPNQPVSPPTRRPLTSLGPEADILYPNDPYLLPFMAIETEGAATDARAPTHVTAELVSDARLIKTPEERSLALQRISQGAIASNQLFLAHRILEEATTAALKVNDSLIRDQRLIAIVTSLNMLTVGTLRVGKEAIKRPMDLKVGDLDADAPPPEPLPRRHDPLVLIRLARLEWNRAVYLSSIIDNPTYRNEMLYQVAESEASGSATVANEFFPVPEPESLGNRPAPAAGEQKPAQPPEKPAPAKPAEKPAPAKPTEKAAPKAPSADDYKKIADSILIDSFEAAKKIDRLIWKYRAMVRIALLAADSSQYIRGIDLSRKIENGESRAEAMLLLAEAACRHNLNEPASPAYSAAAEAIATVKQEGLRGVLAGFLIDSLISTGRFTDARACVVLYPDESQRFVGLGAIAEAQGRRGLADSARRWIATEAPESYRPGLYRRVTTGVLWAIEQNRAKDFDPVGSYFPTTPDQRPRPRTPE
jgi:hypothetical protein